MEQNLTKLICKAVDPEYILLFGTRAGGTPHSNLGAYDILVVTSGKPKYDWVDIKSFFRLKTVDKHTLISNINIYIHDITYIKTNPHIFFCLAHSEGQLLYCREQSIFHKYPIPHDYQLVYHTSANYYANSFNIGDNFLKDSKRYISENNLSHAAFWMKQAMVMFLRTLFLVYHGYDIECSNVDLLYNRLKTISTDLTMLLNSNHTKVKCILSRVDYYQTEALLNSNFTTSVDILSIDVEIIEKMKNIIQEICYRRLELYKSRIK